MRYSNLFIRSILKGYVKIPKPKHIKGDYKTSFYKNLRVIFSPEEFTIIFYTIYFKRDGKLQMWQRKYKYELGMCNLKKRLRRSAQDIITLYESHADYKENSLRNIDPKRTTIKERMSLYDSKQS